MLTLPPEQLKKILADDGIIAPEAFDAVLVESSRMGQSVPDILISRGVISDEYYNGILANFYGVTIATLDPATIDSEILNLIPEEFARSRRVVALSREASG